VRPDIRFVSFDVLILKNIYVYICIFFSFFFKIRRGRMQCSQYQIWRIIELTFEEYSLFYGAFLQKRPIILRSLLIVATLYPIWRICEARH